MTPTMRYLLPCLCLLVSPWIAAQGRIVVAHDEWTLSNSGFASASSTGRFAQNVAAWFTGGTAGSFRAWSSNFGVTQSSLANAMTTAGHTWTVSTAGTFDLATLRQYDGVFVVGDAINAAVLTQYVQTGGNVYVCAGTSGTDPSRLNPFLASFGLALGALNSLSGTLPITNAHPVLAGVTSLYHNNGNSITVTGAPGAATQILVTQGSFGLYAVYDPAGIASATLGGIGSPTTLGVPTIQANGLPTFGNLTFAIQAGLLLPNGFGVGLLGFGALGTGTPIAGAPATVRIYGNPMATQLLIADGGGGASLPLVVPNSLAFTGLGVTAQIVAIDPALPDPIPIGTSPGLQLIVGY